MRDKSIKRFAAGTIGVCFAYALIRQPFAVIKNPGELITADWSIAAQSATLPAATYPAATVPSAIPTEPQTAPLTELPSTIVETVPPTEALTEAPATEVITEPVREEIITDNQRSGDQSDEEWQPEQNDAGGDIPSLTQFLSSLICGGCRHNCSLISPRCMKGRAKAESATVEYYETYGT